MLLKARIALVPLLLCSMVTLPTQAQPTVNGHSRGVTTQGALVTDTIARYSLVMPAGWVLDPSSRGGDVKLNDANGRVSCRLIMMDPSPLSVQEQFMLYRDAQAMVYKRVTKVRQRWGSLGGERAGVLESRRTTNEGSTDYAWNVVTVRGSVPYVIDCRTGPDQAEAARSEVEQLIGSFHWLGGTEETHR